GRSSPRRDSRCGKTFGEPTERTVEQACNPCGRSCWLARAMTAPQPPALPEPEPTATSSYENLLVPRRVVTTTEGIRLTRLAGQSRFSTEPRSFSAKPTATKSSMACIGTTCGPVGTN